MSNDTIKLEGIIKECFLVALSSATNNDQPATGAAGAVLYAMDVARQLNKNLINENEIPKLDIIKQVEEIRGSEVNIKHYHKIREAYYNGSSAAEIASDRRFF